MGTEALTINFGKVNAVIAFLVVLVGLAAAWTSMDARLSVAETRATEAKSSADSALSALQTINVRLERMQTILERLDQGAEAAPGNR